MMEREKELRQKLSILSRKRSNRRIYKKHVQESHPNMGFSSVFVNEASPGSLCCFYCEIDDDKEEIESAITKLKEEGYLNDKQFAEWYCLQRQDYNPRSQRVLYLELITKGVSPSIAKEIIHDYHCEEECCKSVALRKVGCMSHNKLVTYLLGKVIQ